MQYEPHEVDRVRPWRLRIEEVMHFELYSLLNFLRLGFEQLLTLLENICQVLDDEIDVLDLLGDGDTRVARRASDLRH